MHGAKRDGEEDLRGEVEVVAVTQQHAEQKSAAGKSAALLL